MFLFFIPVWNLVTIASERYLAVCQPFKHGNFTKSKVLLSFGLNYLLGMVCTAGAAFQVCVYGSRVTCVLQDQGVGKSKSSQYLWNLHQICDS